MNEITLLVVRIIVAVVAALISAFVIPYLNELKNSKKYAQIVSVVETAVRAAEQTITGEGKGTIKKAEVLERVSNWLVEKGITISAEQLDSIIESAVYGLKGA